jgi:hypothetical protein
MEKSQTDHRDQFKPPRLEHTGKHRTCRPRDAERAWAQQEKETEMNFVKFLVVFVLANLASKAILGTWNYFPELQPTPPVKRRDRQPTTKDRTWP